MSKFLLDFKKLNEDAEKMNQGSSGSYFTRKEIPANGEVDIRLLPPLPSLNGYFYLKKTTVWINRKPYVSPKTFNEPCPILDLVDQINKGDDDDLKLLVKSKSFSVSEDYVIPILVLDVDYKDNEMVKCEVVDNQAKLFDVTFGILKKLTNAVTNRHYQNDTGLGLMDRVKGHNITISKEVKADKTNYDIMVWPTPLEMDDDYYDEIPDIVEITKKKIYDDDTLTKVARNYFYGEEMPKDLVKRENDSTESKIDKQKKKADPIKSEKPKKSGSALLDLLKSKKGS